MYNYNYFNADWYKMYEDSSRNMLNSPIFDNTNTNISTNPSLVNPEEGYNRGNLFADLYDQYKNYRPDTLRANNERERLFLDLSRMRFAAHEINLYLDLNPNDTSMIRLFNDYRKKANELMNEYESKYGPLNIMSDSLDKTPFMWEKSPWPWEV